MPRTSACSPWITSADVQASPGVQAAIYQATQSTRNTTPTPPVSALNQDVIDVICAECAAAATETLYQKSGKQFTGLCGPVTIRPVFRPTNADTRGWVFAGGGGWGYGWGASAMGNLGMPPVLALYAEERGAVIELYDYPVNEILQVKIDGVVIPSDEWELRDFRWLLRMRPTSDFVPTQRWGWPTSQIPDLPDTQQGTFSITYTYGQDPGQMGRMAAVALAEFFALPLLGNPTAFPQRVTSITRQGVTTQIASSIDIIKTGSTGIPLVDLWLNSVNPKQLTRKPRVWSPDIGRNPRQQYPSPIGES
jgi:hypothetical protein